MVERRVSPLGLVLKAGLWYLVAAAGTQPRTYRVASILQMQAADGAAEVPPRFDLARYWARFSRDYEQRMQAGSARVRARPAALPALARLSHAMSRAVAAAGPCSRAGWHELDIPIESIDVAVGELLRLGPDVQALGPPELRRALRAGRARTGARSTARANPDTRCHGCSPRVAGMPARIPRAPARRPTMSTDPTDAQRRAMLQMTAGPGCRRQRRRRAGSIVATRTRTHICAHASPHRPARRFRLPHG